MSEAEQMRAVFALVLGHAAISAGETYSADLAVQRADDLISAIEATGVPPAPAVPEPPAA